MSYCEHYVTRCTQMRNSFSGLLYCHGSASTLRVILLFYLRVIMLFDLLFIACGRQASSNRVIMSECPPTPPSTGFPRSPKKAVVPAPASSMHTLCSLNQSARPAHSQVIKALDLAGYSNFEQNVQRTGQREAAGLVFAVFPTAVHRESASERLRLQRLQRLSAKTAHMSGKCDRAGYRWAPRLVAAPAITQSLRAVRNLNRGCAL